MRGRKGDKQREKKRQIHRERDKNRERVCERTISSELTKTFDYNKQRLHRVTDLVSVSVKE